MKILAIETSCDETAAAVIEVKNQKYGSYKSYEEININNKKSYFITNNSILHTSILSNVIASQINLHKKYGGVFPELASRAHSENIISVVEQALKKSTKDISMEVIKVKKYDTNNFITYNSLLSTIDYIAVTSGPGLIGSLLIGVNFAKTLSFSTGIPIIGINHWLGHIYSTFSGKNPKFPLIALIVSGGHTGLVLMKSHTDITPLGETLDDAAGEAFDKVAKMLGLDYPGGPAVAACAAKVKSIKLKVKSEDIKLPRSMLDSGDYNFSFSGLKTAVLYKVKKLTETYNLKPKTFSAAIAAEFQQAVIDILVGKTIQAAKEFKPKSILLCGGVSANYELREQMENAVSSLSWHPTFHKPPLELTGDNAAMIGIAAAYHLDQSASWRTTWDKIHANSNLKLG